MPLSDAVDDDGSALIGLDEIEGCRQHVKHVPPVDCRRREYVEESKWCM